MLSQTVVLLSLSLFANAQHYSATYLPSNAPKQSEQGQNGTNQCGGGSDQNSMCQNAYLNSVDDFCLFAPPSPGANSDIGNTERIEVAWCMKSGYGTRLIPDGTMQGAHFIQTPDYVQITGIGDLTKLNVPKGDAGGELDPHGADGNGNPIGGLVFSNAFGSLAQMHEWTNFMSDSEFCFRACKDGPKAPGLCQHIYDVMGCQWNMPGNYAAGTFEKCKGDSGEPMGVYGTSTFFQGQPATPAAHPAPASSQCVPFQTIANGVAATAAPTSLTSAATTNSTIPSSTSSLAVNSTAPVTTSTASSGVVTTASITSAPTVGGTVSVTAGSSTPTSGSSGSTTSGTTSSGSNNGTTGSNSGNTTNGALGLGFTSGSIVLGLLGLFVGML
ncbi:macrophage activating glycoprotein [Abortiporus biennis]